MALRGLVRPTVTPPERKPPEPREQVEREEYGISAQFDEVQAQFLAEHVETPTGYLTKEEYALLSPDEQTIVTEQGIDALNTFREAKYEQELKVYEGTLREQREEEREARKEYREAEAEQRAFEREHIEISRDQWVLKSEWNKLTPEQQKEVRETGQYTVERTIGPVPMTGVAAYGGYQVATVTAPRPVPKYVPGTGALAGAVVPTPVPVPKTIPGTGRLTAYDVTWKEAPRPSEPITLEERFLAAPRDIQVNTFQMSGDIFYGVMPTDPLQYYASRSVEQKEKILETYAIRGDVPTGATELFKTALPVTLTKTAEIAVPGFYTITHWERMSAGERALSIALDALIIVPVAAAAGRVARTSMAVSRVGRLKDVIRGTGGEILRQATAPVEAMLHPIKTAKGLVRSAQDLFENVTFMRKIPEASITTTYSTVRLPITSATSADEAMRIRDMLMKAVAAGDTPIVEINGVRYSLSKSALMKEVGGGLVHTTPSGEVFETAVTIANKPGMPLREQGLFMANEPLPRFVTSTAFGGTGTKPAIVIVSENVAKDAISSGKLYTSVFGSVAEMERKFPVGYTIAAPKQALFTRVGADRTKVLILLDNPLSIAQIAKLKALAIIENIKAMFNPSLLVSGGKTSALTASDELLRTAGLGADDLARIESSLNALDSLNPDDLARLSREIRAAGNPGVANTVGAFGRAYEAAGDVVYRGEVRGGAPGLDEGYRIEISASGTPTETPPRKERETVRFDTSRGITISDARAVSRTERVRDVTIDGTLQRIVRPDDIRRVASLEQVRAITRPDRVRRVTPPVRGAAVLRMPDRELRVPERELREPAPPDREIRAPRRDVETPRISTPVRREERPPREAIPPRVPREPEAPRIPRIPPIPRTPRIPPRLPPKKILIPEEDEGIKEKGRRSFPAGVILWRQGALETTGEPPAESQWKAIFPPYKDVKPITLEEDELPPEVDRRGRTPQETIQIIGGPAPITAHIDLGVVDIIVHGGSEKITFTGGGVLTDVGKRHPSNVIGMTIEEETPISRPISQRRVPARVRQSRAKGSLRMVR